MSRIRILVVDDHPIVRSGITSVLATQSDLEVVGEAENGSEAITAAARLEPDLVLMDLRMPVLNGVAASAAILAARPATRIVVLTTYASDGEVLRAIEAGAVGYLLKDVPHEELFRALRAVAKGARYLAPAVTERLDKKNPRGFRGFFVRHSAHYSGWMFDACLPFGPEVTSNETRWFSCRDLKPWL